MLRKYGKVNFFKYTTFYGKPILLKMLNLAFWKAHNEELIDRCLSIRDARCWKRFTSFVKFDTICLNLRATTCKRARKLFLPRRTQCVFH